MMQPCCISQKIWGHLKEIHIEKQKYEIKIKRNIKLELDINQNRKSKLEYGDGRGD